VAELAVGLFYDENKDGIPQLQEYAGFGSRDQVTWVILPNPPKGRYIIKVQGWNVLGNPGHFDREIMKFNGYGIGAHQTSNNTISQNLITENYAGLYLQSCSNTTMHTNNVTKNLGGIVAGDLIESAIYANEIFSNNFTICLRASRDINVTNNVLFFNIFGIHLWNSSHVSVTENDLYSHEGWSIGLIASVDNNVANNNISKVDGLDGIRLMFSSRNNLAGNNISYCEHSGILLWYDCYNNSATSNHISHSGSLGWGHGHGIEVLLSSNNVFANNVISFNERNQGIVAIETSNNNFTGNLISSNRKGIQLRSSYGNRVYHNNLIDNWEQQGYDDTGENFWDDDYPSGGNYWSNYAGIDIYHGSYQNATGSDGIGDTPYIIDLQDRDYYPLMKPYPWAIHDVGITSVTASGKVVGLGYNVFISMMAFNYGNTTETIDITIYANSTIIGEINNVDLESRNFTIVSYTWNTSGFAKGNYTIKAIADSVPSEIDTTDNTLTDGWVQITKAGDLGGGIPPQFFKCDGKVDGKDLSLFLQCFKKTAPQETMYLGDLGGGLPPQFYKCDGKVDGKDLALFLQCFKGLGP
jgi:parallel beta-helix repeat protein